MSVWIISVGSADLQLPLHTKRANDCGQVEWCCTHRARLPEGGLRKVHEGLEKLAASGLIQYVTVEKPLYRAREDEDPPKLVLVADELGMQFQAEYARVGAASEMRFRLDAGADALPTEQAPALPLALPKLDPILSYPQFKSDPPRSVVVLNTRRTRDAREPVASGPLVAQRMAVALDMTWQVKGDPLVEKPELGGHASSVDIVCGDETFEADRDQERCQQRLLWLCRQIERQFPEERIWLTNSGGAQQVKDGVRRTLEAFFSEARVTLLTVSEKTDAVDEQPLSQTPTWVDRDRVRGAVARALRARQLVTAFGLASSLNSQPEVSGDPWVDTAIGTLGPLCMLPTPVGTQYFNGSLSGSELVACRCEVALMQNDLKLAILHLGTLFELLHKDLVRAHPVFQHQDISFEPDGVTVRIRTTGAYQSLAREFSQFLDNPDAPLRLSPEEVRIRNAASNLQWWFNWLIETPGLEVDQGKAVERLKGLHEKYRVSQVQWVRNQVVHESISPAALKAAEGTLRSSGLLHLEGDYPSLLKHSDWWMILNTLHLREPWLWRWLDETLGGLLEQVRAPKGRIT